MILQKDARLCSSINTHGCYFMSIMFLANKHINLKLSTVTLDKVFRDCVELGYITDNDKYTAFIESAESIFKHVGMKAKYTNNHESPKRNCSNREIEILCLRNSLGKKHFVVGDGKGHVAYDPWGVSNTDYKLQSKRIFKL